MKANTDELKSFLVNSACLGKSSFLSDQAQPVSQCYE